MSAKPRLLDLFCGAGGAAKGYQRAGFYVVGVDNRPQPNYCGDEFIQGDALRALAESCPDERHDVDYIGHVLGCLCTSPSEFDAIHASPPCQRYSTMGNRSRALKGDTAPDLLPPTLELLKDITIPWVVENVAGAKALMPNAFVLSGGMFGLNVHRPRYFASNVLILLPPKADPPKNGVGVYGRTHDGRRLFNRKSNGTYRAPRTLEEAQDAMGMDWADWHGTKEAIPPAYTELIGHQLMQHVRVAAGVSGADCDRRPPCVGCGRDCAPRQVYCNRCRKALRLEGSNQGRRYGLRMMDSPEADLPRMSDELREAVREAKP